MSPGPLRNLDSQLKHRPLESVKRPEFHLPMPGSADPMTINPVVLVLTGGLQSSRDGLPPESQKRPAPVSR